MTVPVRFRINRPNVVSDLIDGEVVVVNVLTGAYYSLDNAGVTIWQALDTGLDNDQILEQVRRNYDGPAEVVSGAVRAFVQQLGDEGLIGELEAGAPAAIGRPAPAPAVRAPFVPPTLHKYQDMQDLILLDPIHEVEAGGWPLRQPDERA